jgi:hypothetical protein
MALHYKVLHGTTHYFALGKAGNEMLSGEGRFHWFLASPAFLSLAGLPLFSGRKKPNAAPQFSIYFPGPFVCSLIEKPNNRSGFRLPFHFCILEGEM